MTCLVKSTENVDIVGTIIDGNLVIENKNAVSVILAMFVLVENLPVGLFVCLSSLQDFEYRPFISYQDHARPHISYSAGQRMMSAVIWRCQ